MSRPIPASRRKIGKTFGFVALALLLAGCETSNSMSEGVGFGDYQRYMRERDRGALQGRPQSAGAYAIPPENTRTVQSSAPLATTPTASTDSGPLPVTPPGATYTASTAPVAPAAPAVQPSAAPVAGEAPRPGGVQNEQDYLEVLARGEQAPSPEAAAPAQIVRVDNVPTAGQGSGTNVVAYALRTTHPVGEERHRRVNPLRWSTWERNCLAFAGQDAAQEAFLANGGPERDRGNLDPDGDGFACWWDPTPYRSVTATR